MKLRLYVHRQGPESQLGKVARKFDELINQELARYPEGEVDAIFVSFSSTSEFESGWKIRRKKIRRNFTRKLLTGGSIHYRCAVEIEVDVADAEIISLQDSQNIALYIKDALIWLLPKVLKGLSVVDESMLGAVVSSIPQMLCGSD